MLHIRRRAPLSLKDSLVLELLQRKRPGVLDVEALAKQLYLRLQRPQPQYWRMTMATTLKRLQAAGAPIRQIAGEKGRGNRREWRLTGRKAVTPSWSNGSSPAGSTTSPPPSGRSGLS